MKHHAIALSILCLAAVSPTARGQSPASKLNCNQQGVVVNGLVSFCQLREVTLPSADGFTVNGAIEIDVPADCATHVTASTVMGVINTNFPVPVPAGWGWFGRSLSFDIGSSSASGLAIRAATTLGSIQLRRQD